MGRFAIAKRWLICAGVALLASAAPASVFGQSQPGASAKQSSSRKSKSSRSNSAARGGGASERTTGKGKKSRKPPRKRGQTAPTPARIKEIQLALAQSGHYSGEPTGKWDASTVEAMKHFQEAQGLKPTGKLDAPSLQKLGLGSHVAGLAPPRTPLSPAAKPASPPR